jgi:DNA-binding transcriptional ArsR family regulator
MNYLATIQDDGRLLVRAKDGSVHDVGRDLSLDGLDPAAFDLDGIRRDLHGEVTRVQHESDLDEVVQAEDGEDLERLAVAERWDPLVEAGSSLLDVDIDSPVEWVPGAEGIIRKAERQSWVANFGQGKTQALSHFIVQVCEAGGRVIHIDAENDKREMAERIKPIAEAWNVDIRRRHAYHNSIDVLRDPEASRPLLGALPVADLLVIDSLSRVLSLLDYDENSNPDVIRFMTDIVDVIAKQVGVAVLILDNTGKQGKDARGAVSKAATVEAVYEVSGGAKVSESQHGTLKLKLQRSRSGKLARLVEGGSGGGEWDRLAPSDAAPDEDSGVVGTRLLIKSFLSDRSDEEFTYDQIGAALGINPKTVARRLGEVKREGFATSRKQGNTNYWSSAS